MKRLIQLVVAMALALSVSLPSADPSAAYSLHNKFFAADIIDTDDDGLFDLSVCFGDNTSQGVYIGRSHLMARLQTHFNYIYEGDYLVNGRDYQNGFVTSGVCNDDGSSIHIHYWNWGQSTPVAQISATANGPDASPQFAPNGRECHVFLNTQYSYSWELPTESGKLDGGAIVTHEILHCIGLNDSNGSGYHNTIMHVADSQHHGLIANCGSTAYGNTHWITADDIMGAKLIHDWDGHYFQTTAFLLPYEGSPYAPPNPCTD